MSAPSGGLSLSEKLADDGPHPVPVGPIVAAVAILVSLIIIGLLLRYGSAFKFLRPRDELGDRVPLLGGKAVVDDDVVGR